jgi:hypothetical protein
MATSVEPIEDLEEMIVEKATVLALGFMSIRLPDFVTRDVLACNVIAYGQYAISVVVELN